jgi:hypothetical protein
VRTFLIRLENVQKVTITPTHGMNLLSICNYAKYQDSKTGDNPADNPAVTQRQPIIEEGEEDKLSATQSAPTS